MLAFVVILAITITPIVVSYLYFRRQREVCEKYPFFTLRDKIIWEIARTRNSQELQEVYERANFVAKQLKELNFGFLFFTKMMTNLLEKLILGKYEEALKGVPIKDCPFELNQFDKELATLVVEAAKNNCLLLRLAMKPIGFRILSQSRLSRATYEFLKRHPNLLSNRRIQLKTIHKYSVLANCI